MNDLLKKQVESLENQVRTLTRNLDFIDERFKRFVEDIESGQPATLLEFSDMASDITCLDAEQQGLDVSRIPEIIREIPLDGEVLAKAQLYTETMLAALERNSGLSGQLEAYQLRNQVIQAGLINANLMRVSHSLKWKNSLLSHKYNMKKLLSEHQKKRIFQLETMLDTLYAAYNSVSSLIDKIAPDGLKSAADLSTPRAHVVKSFSKGSSQRKFRRPTKIDMSKIRNSFADRSSFLEGESSEMYGGSRTFKYRTMETNLQVQTSYNGGLKAALEETEVELKRTREFVEVLQGQICTSHEQERIRWTRFLDLFKANCEKELMRKQEEVMQLNQLLSSWIQKYMNLQEEGAGNGASAALYREMRQLCALTAGTMANLSNPTDRLKALIAQSPIYAEKTSSTKLGTMVTLGAGDESPPACE
jgi:hypothetical protein